MEPSSAQLQSSGHYYSYMIFSGNSSESVEGGIKE